MRIYFALTRTELEMLGSLGAIDIESVSKLSIYAQTEQWVATQDETDPDVLDDEILHQSITDLPGYLVVAEVADSQVSEKDSSVGLVKVNAPIRRTAVAAFFLADENAELSWFGPTELPVLLDLGR